jgi:type I restriction enzyme, S subunit
MAQWQTVPMGELCSIQSGKSDTKDAVSDGPYAFFDRSKSIKRSSRFLRDCEALIIPGEGTEFLPRHFVGKFDLHQRAYALFDFSSRLEVKFLFHYLHYVADYFPKVAVGATVKSLRMRHFEQLPVRLTDIAEQRRIVAFLDKAFEGIAIAKANAEKNLQNAREVFEATLQSTFGQAHEGNNPATLGAVCKFVGGSQPPKSEFVGEPREGYVRLIQIRDYKSDKKAVYIPKDLARRFCVADDVMIGRYGPPLFQILRGIDGAYNVALMKAVPDQAVLSKSYLYYFLRHRDMLNYIIASSARAAGQIGLNKETIEPYPIYVPDLCAQAETVSKMAQLEDATQGLVRISEQKLAALDELKKSLLHQAFTGQL